ncbi:single-stranded DNA-binding protein [Methylosarcina fibrata]|uniref:single-stranded DNA-binding protein n=1 Tax=Methylosarcina fibrata TaxID=105972 RepID=UPI00037FA7B3|nr:single-stranded DNA-binding protein [Methylosarcina fibrata]
MIDALITGKLLRDPALKTGSSGKPYCNFLLSVPTNDGEYTLVSGIAFGDVAGRLTKLQKGDALSVAGSLKPSEWADKSTGEIKRGLSITVSAALSAYDVKKRRGGESRQSNPAPPSRGYPNYDDALPFRD